MATFDAGKIEGTADLDLTPFHRALDEAEARAEAFEHHTYTGKLDLDAAPALRQYADMRDRLDEYADRSFEARLGLDTARARTDIETIRRELASLDTTVHVHVVGDGAGGSRAGGGGGGGGGDLFSSLRSGLLGTALALSPGAIPLAGVAGAGLLGTAGGLGVAGLGAGAFGLAAAPEVKQLTTAMTQLTAARTAYNKAVAEGSKSGEHDALATQRTILAGLNSEQKGALAGLVAFQGAYKNFEHDLQPTTLKVLQDVLATASHLLPIVEPLARATGTALDGIVRDFDKDLSRGGLVSFFQSLSKDVGPDLRAVAGIVENLAADGGRLLLALQPLAMTVLPALERATSGLGRGNGLESFLNYAVAEAPVVGHALSGILGLAGSLVHALAPLGGAVLVGVGDLARALSHDLNSAAFAGFVHDLARTVPPLATGLGHLAGAAVTLLHDLGPVLPVVAGLAADAATLLDDLGPLPAAVLAVWTAFKGYTILSDAIGATRTWATTSIALQGSVAAAAATDAATTQGAWAAAMASSTISAEEFTAAANAQFLSIVGSAETDAAAVRSSWAGALGILATVGAGGAVLVSYAAQQKKEFDASFPAAVQQDVAKSLAGKVHTGSISAADLRTQLQQSGLTPDQVPGAGLVLAAASHGVGGGDNVRGLATASAAKPPTTTHTTPPPATPSLVNSSLLTPFGTDPGVGGGGAAAAANAQLVDYQQQISTGLAAAIKRGTPAVQDETRKLRDTILREFKNPAAARERQQALALLAQEAPKALREAQKNAEDQARVLGTQITQAIVKSVQAGSVAHEITSLESKIVKTLNGPNDAAERKALLADLERQLPILKGYATQYAALQTALAADKSRLTALQSQEASFRSTAYSALSGGASLTDALSSGQGITNYLTNQLTVLQSFTGDLKQLKAAGIGSAALEMIVAAGPVQGGAIAKALLTSGTAGTASSLIDQIQALAGTTADTAEHEVYDPQLAGVQAGIDTLNGQVTTLIKTVSASAKQTGTTVAQGLTGTARTAKRKAAAQTKPKSRVALR